MNAKSLEKVLLDADFPERYEEMLTKYMDTEIYSRILTKIELTKQDEESSEGQILHKILKEISDYYSAVCRNFYPLVRSENKPSRPEETLAPPPGPKKKLEYKDRVIPDFQKSFSKHLKYCLLPRINYSKWFDLFLSEEFPKWKQRMNRESRESSGKMASESGPSKDHKEFKDYQLMYSVLQEEGLEEEMEDDPEIPDFNVKVDLGLKIEME